MVACEAREHGHDSKHEASSGRTNNARKGVDESVWAVQLVEHAGKKVTEEKMIVLEENRARGEHAAIQAGRPRPADLPYKRSPPGSRLLQASIPLLPQFVCSILCAQNHRRHSQPSQA
jgi:hypothetical protein